MRTLLFIDKKTSLVVSTATYPSDYFNPYEVHPDFICVEVSTPPPPETVENLYFKDGEIKVKPQSPSEFHKWNVEMEVYEEDMEKAKEHYFKELRIARKQGEGKLKAFYRNVWFNADAQAETDLVSAIITEAFPQGWRALDNQNHQLTMDDAKALLDKIRKVRLGHKESYWQLRGLVESAVSIATIPVHSIETYVKENRQL